MKPLIPLLLLLAVLVLTGAAAAEEENLIHPPESGVIVTGFTEIDSVQPDTAAAEAFMQSPVYNTVTDCLMQKNTPETLPEEILNLTLVDFPYRTADGEEMICSITVAELLNGMNTTFTGHGWGSSYQTHEYIEISVGDPAWKTDLINAWNFIQVMAQQNGFDNNPRPACRSSRRPRLRSSSGLRVQENLNPPLLFFTPETYRRFPINPLHKHQTKKKKSQHLQ